MDMELSPLDIGELAISRDTSVHTGVQTIDGARAPF